MSTKPVMAPSSDGTLSRRGFFMKLGILFNGFAAMVVAVPIAALSSLICSAGSREGVSVVGAVGQRHQLSGRRDADGYISQSIRDAYRWKDRRHRMLGAAYFG